MSGYLRRQGCSDSAWHRFKNDSITGKNTAGQKGPSLAISSKHLIWRWQWMLMFIIQFVGCKCPLGFTSLFGLLSLLQRTVLETIFQFNEYNIPLLICFHFQITDLNNLVIIKYTTCPNAKEYAKANPLILAQLLWRSSALGKKYLHTC